MKKIILLLSIILIRLSVVAQNNTMIRPGEIWSDTEGKHINAHGVGVIFYNGTYYWFGESRLARDEKDR